MRSLGRSMRNQIVIRKILLISVIILAFPGYVFTQEVGQGGKPLTAKQIEKLQGLDELENLLGKMKYLSEEMFKEKYYMCLKAFGHAPYCKCLKDNLPMGVSFNTYINIITTSKEKLNYNQLKGDDKVFVDKSIAARELCVAKVLSN